MSSTSATSEPKLWLNGRFFPVHGPAISPLDRGFMYGDGVFETIRAQGGKILYLEKHIERLGDSLMALRIDADLPLQWEGIILELLLQNNLLEDIATVKIMISRGICPGMGMPSPGAPTVCVTALKYPAPDEAIYNEGWRLHIFREGFAPPLARYKTLNYLYFMMARQAALDAGADEAVVVDPHGRVTETSSGSILARTRGKWWTPKNDLQLRGITLQQVIELMGGAGEIVERRVSTVEELFSAETVWILNSMIGIMPVCQMDGHRLANVDAQEASQMRKALFQRGAAGQRCCLT